MQAAGPGNFSRRFPRILWTSGEEYAKVKKEVIPLNESNTALPLAEQLTNRKKSLQLAEAPVVQGTNKKALSKNLVWTNS